MPLFMSRHEIKGPDPVSTAQEIHRSLVKGDHRYGAACLRSWLSPDTHTLFCLIEADSTYLATQLHRPSKETTHIKTDHAIEIRARTGPGPPIRNDEEEAQWHRTESDTLRPPSW